MLRILLAVCVTLVLATQPLSGSVPRTISYQAVLVDGSGVVVPDGTYNITFRLYDVALGGVPIWEETQGINVASGRYNAILGSVVALDTLGFDETYWLAIKVESDPEMTPRIELTSTPYAMTARAVEDSAITGPGIAKYTVVRSVNGITDTVRIAGGANVNVTQNGDTIFVSSAGGGGGLTLPYSGSVSSSADAFFVTQTGTEGAGRFRVDNASSYGEALNATTNGLGAAGSFSNTNLNGFAGITVGSVPGVPSILASGGAIEMLAQTLTLPYNTAFSLSRDASGGHMKLQMDNGNVVFEAGATGGMGIGSGYLRMRNSFAQEYFTVQTTGPLANSSVVFDLSATGDPSVQLPAGSVSGAEIANGSITGSDILDGSLEGVDLHANSINSTQVASNSLTADDLLDEPGVASNRLFSGTTLTGGIQTLLSQSITVPTAGYVLVVATMDVDALHINGTLSEANFSVHDTNASMGHIYIFRRSVNVSTGIYRHPTTLQGLFNVTAGAHTFYVLGEELAGDIITGQPTMSLIFFPTAYGTVVASSKSGGDPESVTGDRAVEMSAQKAEGAADVVQLRAELQAMRERIAQLEAALEKQ